MGVLQIKQYRDFWDIPRIFLVSKENTLLLFDCKFNEEKEDYEQSYKIYLMPKLIEEEISDSWSQLSERAVKYLGEISVDAVKFDETRKRYIDASAISQIDGL